MSFSSTGACVFPPCPVSPRVVPASEASSWSNSANGSSPPAHPATSQTIHTGRSGPQRRRQHAPSCSSPAAAGAAAAGAASGLACAATTSFLPALWGTAACVDGTVASDLRCWSAAEAPEVRPVLLSAAGVAVTTRGPGGGAGGACAIAAVAASDVWLRPPGGGGREGTGSARAATGGAVTGVPLTGTGAVPGCPDARPASTAKSTLSSSASPSSPPCAMALRPSRSSALEAGARDAGAAAGGGGGGVDAGTLRSRGSRDTFSDPVWVRLCVVGRRGHRGEGQCSAVQCSV